MIPSELIRLDEVSVVADGRRVLGPIDWVVGASQQWVVLGPNGGGKSTLVAVASLARHPSAGRVTVLGHELGRADTRRLRASVAVCSAGLLAQLRDGLTAGEMVACGRYGALEPWWHDYTDHDHVQAAEYLARVGLADYRDRSLGTLSSGERQRALLARSLMAEPDVILLDEPTAGLDLAGRESLVGSLEGLATPASVRSPATVLVTHHVEDIPASTTHLLAIADGRAIAAGPIDELLTAELLSQLFGLSVDLAVHRGRWSARASAPQGPIGSWTQATSGSPAARSSVS